MDAIITFQGGMEGDLSKQFHKPNTYLQSYNFRNIGELNSSTGSLVNIKGNECKVTYPVLRPIYKIRLLNGSLDTSTQDISITINGQTTPDITISNDTTIVSIYNTIINNLSNAYEYTGVTVTTKTYSVSYDDDYIIISQQPVYQDCSTVASIASTISIDQTTNDATLATLQFISSTGNSYTSTPYITGSTSLVTIGSTFILNEVFLLTASDDASYTQQDTFNDTFTKPGQIWKLEIDDITKQHTLTLLYSNYLDFTKYHPVAPSAITGRYESSTIKRIYWTDFFNKVRTINVAAPQLMALDPTLLNLQPNVDFSQPILNAIISGTLLSGAYQIAYRLSKVLGSVTNISELSNPVYLNTSSEGATFPNYEGTSGTTAKGIRWTVSDLDTSYDNIEWMVTRKASANAVPTVTSLGIDVINSSGTMTIDYTDPNDVAYSEVTLEEFLLFNSTFTHAKTVDTKDNRLFWGNVKALQQELTQFDARAFRANDAGNILLKNGAAQQSYASVALAAALDETEDTINEYYDANGDYSTRACYLKPSTALTTKVLGGEGINISYEFGTKSIQLDANTSISSSDNWNISTPGNYRTNSLTGNVDEVLIYDYPQNNKFEALKQPERTSLFRGFQHEEIYRTGIEFIDTQGNPYFTKWIADIKMPSFGDTNDNPDSIASGAGVADFRLTFQTSYRITYGQVMYIKFKVDLTSIQDLIGGYQIVRVKRDGSDRTIWGCGLVNPFISENGSNAGATAVLPASFQSIDTAFVTAVPVPQNIVRSRYNPYPNQEHVETLNSDNDDSSMSNFARFKMFDCFDFDIGNRPVYSNKDKLLIRSRLTGINYRNNSGDDSYRQYFDNNQVDVNGDPYSGPVYNDVNIYDGSVNQSVYNWPSDDRSTNDNPVQPFYIFKLIDNQLYTDYTDFLTGSTNDYPINFGQYIAGNDSISHLGYTINNFGVDFPDPTNVVLTTPSGNPSQGKQTLFLEVGNNSGGDTLYTTDYGCNASSSYPFYKLLALYYKPNSTLYGGATYADRSNNEYIPCSEYIPITRHSNTTPFKCFGGDTFTTVYDAQKTFKGSGSEYYYLDFDEGSPYPFLGFKAAQAKFGTTFFFPCTGIYNSELREGQYINKSLNSDAGFGEDDYIYEDFNNAENDIKKFFPKPLNFQTANEWINRIYFSEIKFNNEIQDSWSVYLTNNFYDVEGNYGPINCLISLKENMYYIQERGIGVLMINPVSMVNDSVGQPIKLGAGSEVIQKHYYKSIDIGTSHQWSVYRSQSNISFIDVRHKKIYLFNGEAPVPISDIKGQRNFVIKRLHTELLKNDNPVIDKGILTTYDYYHNEFLYTFNNRGFTGENPNTTDNENLTLAYSEVTDNFSGMYTFAPNIYINSNKYLISTNRDNKLYFHNYGRYGNFYDVQYHCNLKLLINDNPTSTKVFDNIVWMSESIADNVEWNDDFNLYPGSATNPSYPDDINNQLDTFNKIRCYNDWQNTDWTTLTLAPPGNNLTRKERNFNLQIPRNKFNYDTTFPSTASLFNPSNLNKVLFGERIRDKYMIVDLEYPNTTGNRFIVHNLKTIYRISDR